MQRGGGHGIGGRLHKKKAEEAKNSTTNCAWRALPGETEVPGVFYSFLPTGLNFLSPPPVWIASAVIGQVASRLSNYNFSVNIEQMLVL